MFILIRFLRVLINIYEKHFFCLTSRQFSPFNLLDNTFKYLQRGKPLQKSHLAIVSILKSFARFLALYLMTNCETISIPSVNSPSVMPNLLEENKQLNNFSKIELSKAQLTACINGKQLDNCNFAEFSDNKINLCGIFSTDKALELLIVTGLYEEAIYFAQMINDWKSSFLIAAMLKETDNNLDVVSRKLFDDMSQVNSSAEGLLSVKLFEILGVDVEKNKKEENNLSNNAYMKLMDKSQLSSMSQLIKELLLCSVMTRSSTFEPLFHSILQSMTYYTRQLTSRSGALVPAEFYLPAPPIFCIQMQQKPSNNIENNYHDENRLITEVVC